MKNRFNTISSKEWLPFQKSWFRYSGHEELYESNLRFFTLAQEQSARVYFHGSNAERQILRKAAGRNRCQIVANTDRPVNFAIIDLLSSITPATTIEAYQQHKERLLGEISHIFSALEHRRFLAIFVRNVTADGRFLPFAWDLAQHVAQVFSLKDEKIACLDSDSKDVQTRTASVFSTRQNVFYCLYFRKDEKSPGAQSILATGLFRQTCQQKSKLEFAESLQSWYILRPAPRKKDEILHPAKYPEDLVDMFVRTFTQEHDNVFDPMSGTGSTQVGALQNQRNGYGVELSTFFCDIANERCLAISDLIKAHGNDGAIDLKFKILAKDARKISPQDFPAMDYIITSPPYWDMLNMKGAENQAARRAKGLQLNYSDDADDLGNIADYQDFVRELVEIYFNVVELLKPGGFITIVVKNIKKKGSNYPFAWDLAEMLQEKLILLPEVFWCQDDIRIAPYGYGNTWVSNTFHQYCLTFQKP